MAEKQFHLACQTGDVGRFCLLPGDPGSCEQIAQFLDAPKKISQNREFVTYTGTLCGKSVSVVSTGIGGPSAAIAMEELVRLGADTFIRVGTCGGIDIAVQGGDCVIAQAAVRQEGTSREYAPMEYPACADFSVLEALAQTAKQSGKTAHVGVVQSKDSFYGQHAPETMPIAGELQAKWEAWKRLGVLASEMETAALYTVAAVRRVRCGAIYQVLWNQERRAAGLPDETAEDASDAIKIAVGAIKLLIDRENSL